MSEKIQVTCPFCSLLCTDPRISLDGGQLAGFTPHCVLGEAGFKRAMAVLSSEQPGRDYLNETLQKARKWLQDAHQPMLVLSGGLDNETVSAVIQLAKQYSAILVCDEDSSGSILGLAIKEAGFLTGTLRDLHSLSEMILCGVKPASTHPRLGEFLGKDLTTRVLDLGSSNSLIALRWLRLAGSYAGRNIPVKYAEMAKRIEAATSGLVIFGSEWIKHGRPFSTELLLWLKNLNKKNRWYGLNLPNAPNSIGVVEVLRAETGYPGNLRFSPNGIDYSPHVWQAERLIQQGIVDLCILVGMPDSFLKNTLALLSHGQTILLSPDKPKIMLPIWLPTARSGVDTSGLFQRLDGVPVEIHSVLKGKRIPIKDLLIELTREDTLA